ncbi:pentapeptide repeat-containing protein [Vreelandella glaciei]|uniref:pentapeptide repeat-containing protein n=1 Tax=Vreelandella glaciei TaxID=186761 RepID=UPI003001AA36
MSKSKEQKILNTLKRFEVDVDNQYAESLINDFMQISKILEFLKETDKKSFNAFYALVEKNLELEIIVAERGKRISGLQKGQTQPKNTGPKKLSAFKAKEEREEAKDFSKQDLSEKDFQKAELFRATFASSILRNANFRACKAMLACFANADLSGANFTGAKLDKANFRGANLQNADFKSAKIAGANFEDAKIEGAVFDGSNYRLAKGLKI